MMPNARTIALAIIAGAAIGIVVGSLPDPWPTIGAALVLLAALVFLVRSWLELRRIRQARRDLEAIYEPRE